MVSLLVPSMFGHDLLLGQMNFRLAWSFPRRSMRNTTSISDSRSWRTNACSLTFSLAHRNYPQMQFYWFRPYSQKGQRSNYRLEDTTSDIALGLRPFKLLTLGGAAGYVWTNVGPGTSSVYISTEQQFTPAQAPGINLADRLLPVRRICTSRLSRRPLGT